jgi:hypothetical protein
MVINKKLSTIFFDTSLKYSNFLNLLDLKMFQLCVGFNHFSFKPSDKNIWQKLWSF